MARKRSVRMRFLKIFRRIFKKKQKVATTPRIEKDTKCDKCEYLQECIDEGKVVDCRNFEDMRSHYIKGRGSYAKYDDVEV